MIGTDMNSVVLAPSETIELNPLDWTALLIKHVYASNDR